MLGSVEPGDLHIEVLVQGSQTLQLYLQDLPVPARGYGQFWGMRSGSGLVLGSGDGLAVAEADAANDLGETL